MPYASVNKLGDSKRGEQTLKVKGPSKGKEIPIKEYDESVSSFALEGDRHVVKKRGSSKKKGKRAEQLESVSDD